MRGLRSGGVQDPLRARCALGGSIAEETVVAVDEEFKRWVVS
jgi:hypothetical protein